MAGVLRRSWAWLALTALFASLVAWGAHRFRRERLELSPPQPTPIHEFVKGRHVVSHPGLHVMAEVVRFEDELLAYLVSDLLRNADLLQGTPVLLTCQEKDRGPVYQILLELPDDLLTSIPLFARLQAAGLASPAGYQLIDRATATRWRQQSQIFAAAYGFPVRQGLGRVHGPRSRSYVRQFLRPRPPDMRRHPQTSEDLPRLAANLLAVAQFYSLPLEFFAEIGAAEDDRRTARRALEPATWKRRAQRGDVVLKRHRGRVLVVNESSGEWQTTQEALRYTHRLYLSDKRDYARLPGRLRPPGVLRLDAVDPEVLATYAGLLVRDLLDRFNGDAGRAIGAYKSGPANPNVRYEVGVRRVALYTKRVLEQAAVLNADLDAERRLQAVGRSWVPR